MSRVANKRSYPLAKVYGLLVKAWIDPLCQAPKTPRHCGHGVFKVAGETIRLPSKMK